MLIASQNRYLKICIWLSLLNVISNLSFCVYNHSFWALLCMIGGGALIAVIETGLLFSASKISARLSLILLYIILIFHTILICVDYYLLINFRLVFIQDTVDILAEANAKEIEDFILAYFDIKHTLLALLLGISIFYVIRLLSIGLTRIKYLFIVLLSFSLVGVFCLIRMAYSYVKYQNGLSVPQFVAPLRFGYSFKILNQRIAEIEDLKNIHGKVEAAQSFEISPDVILIIGESFSKYHCSLYDYQYNTYPQLQKRFENGELHVFDDAVSVADATHANMKAIFTMGKGTEDFAKVPIFPSCFKAAGYKTVLYDNQYSYGQGVTFLTNSGINDLLFDYRNKDGFDSDESLIDAIPWQVTPALYIVHLWGQHYTYSNRYPHDMFSVFKSSDYDASKYSEEQSEIIAHYDNACLYNDYLVDKVIEKVKDRNCVVIYLSDHGEEVFELGNFFGHGTSMTTSAPSYQLNVPLMVYMSPSYRKSHSDIVESVKKAYQTPILTSDISHTLIDLAGIQCKYFIPELSFINDSYNKNRDRIVMGSYNYDDYLKNR